MIMPEQDEYSSHRVPHLDVAVGILVCALYGLLSYRYGVPVPCVCPPPLAETRTHKWGLPQRDPHIFCQRLLYAHIFKICLVDTIRTCSAYFPDKTMFTLSIAPGT